jgi:hypothetical protein
MSNHWAIAVGINQYRFLQPLLYAQRDAQAILRFWIEEAGLPSNHCLLFSDLSPSIEEHAVYPSQGNIRNAITRLCQQDLQAGDFLWCFFSGYGVRFQEQDYFMPIDGNPSQLPATGIPLTTLFELLHTAPTENILLTLDMNRSQGSFPHPNGTGGIGTQAIALAQQYGIPTILASKPEEFSHETLALRHGLFTAALLEGLRYQHCVTLEQLVQYVSDRLPELSEHHWRPQQHPLAIIPPEKRHLLLLPEQMISASNTPQLPTAAMRDRLVYPESTTSTLILPTTEISSNGSVPITQLPDPTLSEAKGSDRTTAIQRSNGATPTEPPALSSSSSTPAIGEDATGAISDRLFWQRFRLWGGLLASVLLASVLFRYRADFAGISPTSTIAQNPGATDAALQNPGANSNAAISQFPARSSQSPTSTAPTPSAVVLPQSPNQALEVARDILERRSYGEALQLLDQVPQNEQSDEFKRLLDQAAMGVLKEARAAISRPRALSDVNQASDFSTAIQLAHRIKPNHPYYGDAQQDMQRWSRIILELAASRAIQPNQGDTVIAAQNYVSAIKAAQLVPEDQGETFTTAQRLIARWSQNILSLAEARAKEGEINIAIQAASLIPTDAPMFDAAQQAIATWQPPLYN